MICILHDAFYLLSQSTGTTSISTRHEHGAGQERAREQTVGTARVKAHEWEARARVSRRAGKRAGGQVGGTASGQAGQ